MAPSGFTITQPTPLSTTRGIRSDEPTCATPTVTTVNGQAIASWQWQMQVWNYEHRKKKETETKKQKEARIAKEKMLASWKTINRKTETINIIKQICKPRHRVNHMGFRNR